MRKSRIYQAKRKRLLQLEVLERRNVFCNIGGESESDASSELSVMNDPSAPADVDLTANVFSSLSTAEGDPTRAAEAINRFAFELYQSFLQESGNLFLSPMSIAMALGMTYGGARGATAEQMASVLQFGTQPGIHESFRTLLDSLTADEKPYELAIANALWPQEGFPFYHDYLRMVELNYGGQSQRLDYASDPEGAKNTINAWVEEQTRNKIKNLIDRLERETVMVLTNAIYFKAQWQTEFDPSSTQSLPFRRATGDSVDVPMMKLQSRFHYIEQDGFQFVELPYDGRDLSMILMLPRDETNTALSQETLANVDRWLADPPNNEEVDVKLPKFKTTVSSSLKQVLSEMGMPLAFDQYLADFSGMAPVSADQNLFIEKVLHKAFVEVDEQGTEAAAATAVVVGISCFVEGTPIRTPEGDVPIERLRPGDVVLSRDEQDPTGKVEAKTIETTFQSRSEVLELHIGGQIIRTTREHPFYVQNLGWTPASDLRPKDVLATLTGDWIALEKLVATAKVETVYNFRVADYHTYFVGRDNWAFALWTHNLICGESPPVFQFNADHPFHFLIRDNTTSSILFMGRISDPLQTDSMLNPTAVQLEAPSATALDEQPKDTNGDGYVTPLDVLIIINRLNAGDSSSLTIQATDIALMDNSDDGVLAPDDVLIVINWLRRHSAVHAEHPGQSPIYGPEPGAANDDEYWSKTLNNDPTVIFDID